MKHLIITAILCGMLGSVYAQSKTDSIKTTTDTTQFKHRKRSFMGDVKYVRENMKNDSTRIKKEEQEETRTGFKFDINGDLWLGYSTLIDNGSFTLSPKNNFLSYNQLKTSNVGFNVLEIGYRFGKNFSLELQPGFDWTLIRLQQNIDIVPDAPTLTYVVNNTNHYSKNRLSSNYLLLPLVFQFQTNKDKKGKRAHFEFGPEGGFLIDGMQKQISPEHGKTKDFNYFHFTRFEYGSFVRMGYGQIGIFAKYFNNDMFENSPDQQGLKSFSFGLQFGF